MSIELLHRAFRADIRPSSTKFVLVTLADYANDWDEAYPSIQTLCQRTSQDRKTVMTNLQRLQQAGLIVDTGVRRGKTQQVRVYKITLTGDSRNSTKNGTVPKRGLYRFYKKPVPKTVHRTPSNPPAFIYVWEHWPAKRNRAGAEREWKKLSAEQKIAAAERLRKFLQSLLPWQYVPHLSTYLRDRRWQDDLTPPQQPRKKNNPSGGSGLPYHDSQLPGWATANGLPEPRRGETFPDYRARLEQLIRESQKQLEKT